MNIFEFSNKIYYRLTNKKAYLKPNPPKLQSGKLNRYFPKSFILKGELNIGSYCAIGENFRVITTDHDYHLPATQRRFYFHHFNHYPGKTKSGKVTIDHDVWIGDNVTILKNVHVGNGACIGAGSVVTKNIPPYAIVAGVPAQIINHRFPPSVIKFLLKLQWWHWSDQQIQTNAKFFSADLSLLKPSQIQKLIQQ